MRKDGENCSENDFPKKSNTVITDLGPDVCKL